MSGRLSQRITDNFYINKIYPQNEAGSPLMKKDHLARFWLTGLLSWDTDDLSSPPPDNASKCRKTGLPSVFSDIALVERWLEEATHTMRL